MVPSGNILRTESQTLNMILSSRRVDDRKHAERQAHVQRRQEEAARSGRGHVDPFPLNVQRSVGGEAGQIRVEPPIMPQNLNEMNIFYSAVSLDVLLDRLRAALAGMADTPLVTLKQKSAKVRSCGSHQSVGEGPNWLTSGRRFVELCVGCRR